MRFAYDSIASLGSKTGAKVMFLLLGRFDKNDLRTMTEIMPASFVSTGEEVQKHFEREIAEASSNPLRQWQSYPQVISDEGFPPEIAPIIAPKLIESIKQVKLSFDAPFEK